MMSIDSLDLEGGYNLIRTPELLEVMTVPLLVHLVLDQSLLNAFCRNYGTSLVKVDLNREDDRSGGLLYFFDDNSGGYTREGLVNSLNED